MPYNHTAVFLFDHQQVFRLFHGQNLTEEDSFQSVLFREKILHITLMYNVFIH